MNRKHVGPSPTDQQLFKLSDAIEAERSRRGEQAALALVNKALAAVAAALRAHATDVRELAAAHQAQVDALLAQLEALEGCK